MQRLFALLLARGIFIGWSWRFGWWRKKKVKDLLTLLDAIHVPLNRPEYQPENGVTHCNSYVNEVCRTMGYKSFEGLLANQMISLLNSDPSWVTMNMEKCQGLANGGSLVLAGFKAEPHGHIAVICPGREKTSGRWGLCPAVANVGSEVFIGKGVSWAFSVKPTFWVWKPSL